MALKILIIQTAFIGDAILATAVLEKLQQYYPDAQIDFLLRKGNHGLLQNHPFLNELLILDKSKKYRNLWSMLLRIRRAAYSHVINLHRHSSTGLLTAFSGASNRIGFKKNPLSFLFSQNFPHQIGDGTHEIERNQKLIESLTDSQAAKPRLYPTAIDFETIPKGIDYICIAPSSVWFTKQFPKQRWIDFINQIPEHYSVYLLGGPSDQAYCESIIKACDTLATLENWAGKLSFLQSAALMSGASMNYVNDSAPLHIASAMNAPVTALFCSTVPAFGFTPLSDDMIILETAQQLACRPCGLHGHRSCPKGHFDCSNIEIASLLDRCGSKLD